MQKTIRIAGVQGFYGDSPAGAIAIAKAKAADYLVMDALAELTLSILQKDKLRDPNLGYARDIELNAYTLFPIALRNGIKIVTDSGGLNPHSAAQKVKALLAKQGITDVKIAAIDGDDLLDKIPEMQAAGLALRNMDTGQPLAESPYPRTHANVYIGAQGVKDALAQGADIILAGRVADPALTLGILAYEYGFPLTPSVPQRGKTDGLSESSHVSENEQPNHQKNNEQPNSDKPPVLPLWGTEGVLDFLAAGILIGHLLECGGQASGGNAYSEYPQDFEMWNLGYPIAHVSPDGSVIITKLAEAGGKVSRNTIREQLVYEIHDPSHYITPDVICDFTQVKIEEIAPNQVRVSGAKGKPRPDLLKLCVGQTEGYMSDQIFYFSYPFAYAKAQRFAEEAQKIWKSLPMLKIERIEVNYLGINGIHGAATPALSDEIIAQLPEVGLRLAIRHAEERTGKMAMQAIICLGLNGPPGICTQAGWGKDGRLQLSLFPTLVPREWVQERVTMY
jgi:Acyclic terpene utilisation family protein AtuA